MVYNYEWEEAFESVAMVRLAEMVAASALAREESRGHHWRTDFPKTRSEWEKHTIVWKKSEDNYTISDAPVIRVKDRTKDRREPDPQLVAAGALEEF
jgi:succinate dehydrogenase/fumarate reductase flavoprotein subunit